MVITQKENNLFYIDLDQPYLKTVAKGLIERFNETDRPYVTVLLPSNRGVLELQQAFIALFPNAILPKIDTFLNFSKKVLLQYGEIEDKTISSFERLHFVMKILCQIYKKSSLDHVKTLAIEITTLWDEITLSGKTKLSLINVLENLPDLSLVQQSLLLITKEFSIYLNENNLCDEKENDYKSLSRAAVLLKKHTFKNPIFMAGTTGTIPAVQEISKALLNMLNGYVILPGLQKIEKHDVYHPLYTQNKWMEKINYLGRPQPFFKGLKIRPFVEKIFHNRPSKDKQEIDHIMTFSLESYAKESLLIALITRHHLEISDHNITIVCADMRLTMCIQNELKRFGFCANSSVMMPLDKTVCGKFLRCFFNALITPTLKNLLILFKHPLYNISDRYNHIQKIDAFEKKIEQDDKQTLNDCLTLCEKFSKSFENLTKNNSSFAHWIMKIIENLKDITDNKVFEKADGQQLLTFLNALKSLKMNKTSHTLYTWIEWVFAYMNTMPGVQFAENLHQRVRLIGSLEARHNAADVVIVAGLNEGQWPPPIKTSIWLSPVQERLLNLPEKERRISLNAHDFCNCLMADYVYLTRSVKKNGMPTQESRWLRRLALHTTLSKNQQDKRDWFLKVLNTVMQSYDPCAQDGDRCYPAGFSAPDEMSISAVELLNKDPYAYYIRYILKIKERPKWYVGLSNAHIGQIAHKILEKIDLFKEGDGHIFIEDVLKKYNLQSHEIFFLRQQLLSILSFVHNQMKNRSLFSILREKKISMLLDNISLFGIADRIDILDEGYRNIDLIDYKTGALPSLKSIEKGFSLQIPLLTAMMLKEYKGVQQFKSSYWHLSGIEEKSKIVNLLIDDVCIQNALLIVEKLLKYYFEENKPFLPL